MRVIDQAKRQFYSYDMGNECIQSTYGYVIHARLHYVVCAVHQIDHFAYSAPSHCQAQNDIMTSSNGTIFRVTGHLCGELTGPR